MRTQNANKNIPLCQKVSNINLFFVHLLFFISFFLVIIKCDTVSHLFDLCLLFVVYLLTEEE